MQISVEKTWETAQERLRSRLSAETYNLWFAPLRAHAQDNNSLVLEVPNDFFEAWLKDNYTDLLQDVIAPFRSSANTATLMLSIMFSV